jgi:hypothetical protein
VTAEPLFVIKLAHPPAVGAVALCAMIPPSTNFPPEGAG